MIWRAARERSAFRRHQERWRAGRMSSAFVNTGAQEAHE